MCLDSQNEDRTIGGELFRPGQRAAAAAADADGRPDHRHFRNRRRIRQGIRPRRIRHQSGPLVLPVPFPGQPGHARLPRSRRACGSSPASSSAGWAEGKGMALSTGEVKFKGMVTPDVKLVEYGIDFKRVMRAGWCSASPTAGSRPTARRSTRRPICAWALSKDKTRLTLPEGGSAGLHIRLSAPPASGPSLHRKGIGHETRRRHRHGNRFLHRNERTGR
jgi:hypothetical protein